MRYSQLFTKTHKQAPKDESAANAQLLVRGGFIHKELAGVYDFLPLGLAVLKKLEQIIRQEVNAIGGQEVLLSTLQLPEAWQKSGRWDDKVVDVWFKTKLYNQSEVGLANTHEEPLANLLKSFANSYKDFPVYIYQFQTKLRNELRAKSGLLRGREFIMKDLYSFSRSQTEHDEFYEKAQQAYRRIFERVGLGDRTVYTFASGGSFAKYSHEFQTLCVSGEDTIYVDEAKQLAVNKEVYSDEVLADLKLDKTKLKESKAIEVGNIFSLSSRFSEPLGLFFTDEKGLSKPVIMGSYGIGLGRLMGAVVEVFHDEHGIIWPKAVAPALAHLASLGEDQKVAQAADRLYDELTKQGIEVLYDDRAESAGSKLADADLIGCPYRLVISDKTLTQNSAELKPRDQKEANLVKLDQVFHSLSHKTADN